MTWWLVTSPAEAAMARPSQATQLVAIASDLDLFHTPDEEAYALLVAGEGHEETWPVRSKAVKRWLTAPTAVRRSRSPSKPR